MHTPGASVSGFIIILIVQLILCILFGFLTRYGDELLPKDENPDEISDGIEVKHIPSYPHFQDIHVMIFVGFGFLMTFLKKYGYSACGFNLLVASLLIQWALIVRGLFELEDGRIPLTLDNMIGADIAAAAVLISMGALLGRTSPIQLLIMGLIEIAIFATNEYLQIELMKIADVGGSITVHAFGAYFGLAASFAMRPKKEVASNTNNEVSLEGASYTSDMFAMIGTLFLWIFWPSFNSALVDGPEQHRAILNTYLSLAAATVTTFVISAFVSHDHKLDMVHIQNSTLAGGVAVGAVSNLLIQPHGAILIGILAGLLSVLGYKYLTPAISSKLRIEDTCGVHNLHGMPAIMSALFSAVYAAIATEDNYKSSLTTIFPAMEKDMNLTMLEPHIIGGYGRTAEKQAGYQLLGILTTVAIAVLGGLLTGLFLKSPNIKQIPKDKQHNDEVSWEVQELNFEF